MIRDYADYMERHSTRAKYHANTCATVNILYVQTLFGSADDFITHLLFADICLAISCH